ncbi:MAG: polysaccharide biosynthesis protein [Bacteriovoracaceae bacterium]|nr:polysaccharide biosynthesis protein [Bacteriovoracaceae bacterium]
MFEPFRNLRILTVFVHDAIVSLISIVLAVALRFETLDLAEIPVKDFQFVVLIVFSVQIMCFYFAGLYRGIWRFSSTHDLIRVMKGASFGVLLSIFGVFLFNRLETVPRSAFIINWFLLVVGLGGGRFVYRIWKDFNLKKDIRLDQNSVDVKNVLIVGSGSAGSQLAKDIFQNPGMGLKVVGFIDDNPLRLNRFLHDIKVMGTSKDITDLVKDLNVEKVFIAIPSASGAQIRNIVNSCEESNVEFKILPKLSHLLSDKVSLSILRNVKLEDLLGRDPVKLDQSFLTQMIEGEVVLVTGAGGSIGSEICRQLSLFKPKRIVMYELSEYFLYELENDFITSFPDIEIITIVGDVRNLERLDSVFEIYKPNLVLHAAAYKHVPMMEKNPIEAIRTNVMGTKYLGDIAIKHNVDKFVMISTDKAVNPTNIMGASKRVAEMICRRNHESSLGTKFITVRFGNVLGSNGSVIPFFQKHIEEGRDVPVTHPEIERYFMSIPEACQLVLQAASMGDGGEIYVLDMGEPVKIMDLAKEMIKLAGLELGKDINIKIVGLRPGEKLYEELFSQKEELLNTNHKKVRIANSRKLTDDFSTILAELVSLPVNSDFEKILNKVKTLVPEFELTEMEEENESLH